MRRLARGRCRRIGFQDRGGSGRGRTRRGWWWRWWGAWCFRGCLCMRCRRLERWRRVEGLGHSLRVGWCCQDWDGLAENQVRGHRSRLRSPMMHRQEQACCYHQRRHLQGWARRLGCRYHCFRGQVDFQQQHQAADQSSSPSAAIPDQHPMEEKAQFRKVRKETQNHHHRDRREAHFR